MKLIRPAANAVFTVDAAAVWPSIVFETDAAGPHTWQWAIAWDAFTVSGTAATPSNRWDASQALVDRGGTLTVTAIAGAATASLRVTITGTNPTAADVTGYVAASGKGDGFDRIIGHETQFRHFAASGEPIKSFDRGYGMCQLTTPPPSYEQAWNWKRNVDAGLALFAAKVAAARNYLGQNARAFTPEQLRREAVCRWNGGQYHRWDAAANKWVRTPTILCDSKTGNIGWDMTDPENAGKTEAVLRARDKASYSGGPRGGAHWRYFGVCYADRLLG